MATVDQYKIQIDVAGAEKVKNLENAIDSLGSKLAAIGFGAFIADAFRMADAMTDLSDATGIALENVIAFSNAMSAAGGDANNADKALITFQKNLEEMATGSDTAEEKLNKVGITMQDLRTLSEEQLLQKAIDNLAAMDEGATRTAAGVDNFSKAFNTIDPKKLKDTFDPAKTKEYAANMKLAGDAVDNLAKNFKLLQQAAVDVFGPLLNGLSQFKLDIKVAQQIIITLSALMAAAFGAKAAQGIYQIVIAIGKFNKALKEGTILQAASLALGGPKGWAMLAGGAIAATAAVVGLNKLLEENAEAQKEALAAVGGDAGAGSTPFAPDASEFAKKEKEQRELAAKAAMRTTEQMRKQFEIANGFRKLQIDLIGLQDDYTEGVRQDANVIQQLQNDVLEYEGKIEEEQAKGKDANQAIINQYIEQLKLKQQQAAATLLLNQEERNRIQSAKEFAELMERDLARVNKKNALADLATKQSIANEIISGKITQEKAKYFEQILNLQIKQRDLLNANIAAQTALNNKNPERLKQLKKEEQAIRDRFEVENKQLELTTEIDKKLQESRAAGAIQAMEQIRASMKPYMMAQDAIAMGWQKIGSAIDTFVETGKFKFKDFAASIIQDLTKMILKAMIFKYIFDPIMGALGLSIPGKASGGPVEKGKPYLVGEKGPELFVPPGAGTIIPNNKLGQGKGMATGAVSAPITNNYITNNISAVDAKSVAQLFAENRKTLLGTVRMAEKEMPYMGRA